MVACQSNKNGESKQVPGKANIKPVTDTLTNAVLYKNEMTVSLLFCVV